MENSFAVLNAINVSEYIEKKGQFSYLSWPFAVAQLRLADPSACWEVRRFNDLPYLATEAGFFVEVAVTVQGVSLSQIHPVLDVRNKPILAPTSFDINTSIQRCLVKAIALHGLGLYIYAGEDLPAIGETAKPEEKSPIKTPAQVTPIRSNKGITALQISQIERLLNETGGDRNKLLAYFSYETLAEITTADFPRVIRSLEKRRAA